MTEKNEKPKRYRKRLLLKFGPEGPTHTAFCGDISTGGLFIKTTRLYPPNTTLNIELFTTDNRVVNIEGVVMWAKAAPHGLIHIGKKGGMGIKIIRIIAGEAIYKELCGSQI